MPSPLPFPCFHSDVTGFSDDAEGFIWFLQPPTASIRKKIAALCPPPLARSMTWTDTFLSYGSDEYGYPWDVRKTYRPKGGTWRDMQGAYRVAFDTWLRKTHDLAPILFAIGPERSKRYSPEETQSLEALPAIATALGMWIDKRFAKEVEKDPDIVETVERILFLLGKVERSDTTAKETAERFRILKGALRKSPAYQEAAYLSYDRKIQHAQTRKIPKDDLEEAYSQTLYMALEKHDDAKIAIAGQRILDILKTKPSYFSSIYKFYIYLNMARYFARKGNHAQSMAFLKRSARITQKDPEALDELLEDEDYAWAKDREEFATLCGFYALSRWYGYRGDRTKALTWLKKAIKKHMGTFLVMGAAKHPAFAFLRDDAEFKEIVGA